LRIGVLGGTFDPIHLGHLRAAEVAQEALSLDGVTFIPSNTPPHRAGPHSSALDRFAMVCLATSSNPRFRASDIELVREGPSYTIDTLSHLLRDQKGTQVVVIVGQDTFPEMATWKDSARIFELCPVAVVIRPSSAEEPSTLPKDLAPSARVERVPTPGLPISATDIRRRLEKRLSVRYLVPDAVADYIEKRGLYR